MRRSTEEIIIDLLIFTSCRHPSTKSIGKLSEIDIGNLLNNSICGREFLNLLINYQSNNVSKQNYKVVVSNESYERLQNFLKGLFNKGTIGSSIKVIVPLLRYLTVLTQRDVILLKKLDKNIR